MTLLIFIHIFVRCFFLLLSLSLRHISYFNLTKDEKSQHSSGDDGEFHESGVFYCFFLLLLNVCHVSSNRSSEVEATTSKIMIEEEKEKRENIYFLSQATRSTHCRFCRSADTQLYSFEPDAKREL